MARRRRGSGNDQKTRNLLARLASSRSTRTSGPTLGRPAHWNPGDVTNPEDHILGVFSDESAWDLIVTKLRQGHPVRPTVLRHPPGATAFTLEIELEPGSPPVYVKLELSRHKRRVFGRSFHTTLYD